MPQMFPLLWFYLFVLCIFSLLFMMSMVYFSEKKIDSNFSMKIDHNSHTWKW